MYLKGGVGKGILFSSISCYFLGYHHTPRPPPHPPTKHTHTLTKQENSSKNTCQNQDHFALDCQLVGNIIEGLEMMLSQQITNSSSSLSYLVFPANNSHQTAIKPV